MLTIIGSEFIHSMSDSSTSEAIPIIVDAVGDESSPIKTMLVMRSQKPVILINQNYILVFEHLQIPTSVKVTVCTFAFRSV